MGQLKKFIKEFYGLPGERLPGLEDVLSQLDLAINEGRPLSAEYSLQKLRELRESLVFGMAELLAVRLGSTSSRTPLNLPRFFSGLSADDCIVSLNYDIILDNALLNMGGGDPGQGINYGIDVRYAVGKSGDNWYSTPYPKMLLKPPLYKPHGSLNWVYCPICGKLDVTRELKGVAYLFADERLKCEVCTGHFEALIITPTLFKTYSNSLLLDVWREVENRLSFADEIIFVGYSLPDADIQLRCLLARAIFRNRSRRKQSGTDLNFRVIGWERGRPEDYYKEEPSETHQRYLRLFGEVDYDPTGFEGYIGRGCRTFKQ